MTFEYLADPSGRPAWEGVLPGRPHPFFLEAGQGEHAKLFVDTFSVLLSGDETEGQFGVFTSTCPPGEIIPTHAHDQTHETFYVLEGAIRLYVQMPDGDQVSRLLGTGDFAFVPAGAEHAYRIEEPTRLMGVSSGGFERFFQTMGTKVDDPTADTPPFVPDGPRMGAAAQQFHMDFLPGFDWSRA
ncbi:quercetin 2,3-dioxygenase [Arsenicicoccus bolidensis]|jgi:quercetin 2,3-dioxygenase|uniref:Quercetin 2,3-dioxygenase n=1 Tax=Arsenicicoccus bolidensis TaxID=229480 RepID=A0ABS9Q6C2_9MICO|nr:quercetin 2,3-dioxygenase [Arsenicicoccus bolidensis]MCG7323380.1 quercetin 2,3-dioxygenase [Arsenicicoccus bolidensis]